MQANRKMQSQETLNHPKECSGRAAELREAQVQGSNLSSVSGGQYLGKQ
jgi:hypothetical protein